MIGLLELFIFRFRFLQAKNNLCNAAHFLKFRDSERERDVNVPIVFSLDLKRDCVGPNSASFRWKSPK
jgi:hypothetical protein